MMDNMIDHGTLSRLAQAGAIQGARIVGEAGGWTVRVMHGLTEQLLTAQRSRQVRLFRRFETLVDYLKKMGIAHFEVDTANYDAGIAKTSRRPDRATALKRAHQAATYDTWLREQVQASMDDPRPAVSDDEARVRFAARKAELRQAVQ